MALREFSAFCASLKLESGKPLKLEPFQRKMLAEFFAGATETLILIPKKNGKTTLLAALALYHLTTTESPSCVIAAASRDQATILYNQAAGLVRRAPEQFEGKIKVQGGYRVICLLGEDGKADHTRAIRVLAADENTADGVLPTLALVDELHRHKKPDLYGVLRDGLVREGAQMVTISTAGAHLDSPLGQLRDEAYSMKGFSRKGAHNHARSPDKSFAMHEWALEQTDDLSDMDRVKLANPASWQTKTALKRRHDSPSMTPAQWARFGCGVWTEGEHPWIEPQAWDALFEEDLEIPVGERVWLGVDLGVKHDSTAIVIASAQGDRLAVKAEILTPTSSTPVRVEYVEQMIRNLAEKYDVEGVVYDPWSFRRSAEMLENEGLQMIEHPMSPERMSQASANLYRVIEEGGLVHDGSQAFRSQVLAGVTKETERGWRLVKDPRVKRPIDALIALAVVCQVAWNEMNRQSPFVEVFA